VENHINYKTLQKRSVLKGPSLKNDKLIGFDVDQIEIA